MNTVLKHALEFGAILSLLTFASLVQAEDWPQFRGPNCSGISTGTKPLPVKFSATENVVWSARVGDGVGSPIVVAGRVFVSGMTADRTVSLFAFDAATGEKLWQRDWQTGPLAEVYSVNSHASSTPAADADRVYFYFSTLGLLGGPECRRYCIATWYCSARTTISIRPSMRSTKRREN
jgi:hypothetical protein